MADVGIHNNDDTENSAETESGLETGEDVLSTVEGGGEVQDPPETVEPVTGDESGESGAVDVAAVEEAAQSVSGSSDVDTSSSDEASASKPEEPEATSDADGGGTSILWLLAAIAGLAWALISGGSDDSSDIPVA